MQISKKLYTSLVITLLALSTIVAAIPMVSAEITTAPVLYVTPTPPAAPSVLTTGGPVGSRVTVMGTVGAGDASPFSTVTAYWDSLSGKVLGTAAADVNGEYRIDVVIPNAVFGTHYIVVNDGESESEGAAYDVTPVLNIPPTAINTRALPGDQLAISGSGFAAGDAITITFDGPTTVVLTSPAITTNTTGSFSATITVPLAITEAFYGTYTVYAEDEATNTASDLVDVDYYILATPLSGPTGITTTISGRIVANMPYTITFNGAPVASGTTAADGSYSNTYTIPGVLSPNPYTIEIVWATINSRDVIFTVTASPTIALGSATGIVGQEITITGSGFSSLASITLKFGATTVNDTSMGFGPTTFGGAIPAGSTFIVPTLTPGIYTVTVVDQYGATSAAAYFTIEPTPVLVVETRAMAYKQGDQISIKTQSNVVVGINIDIEIKDPSGLLLAEGTILVGDWVMISPMNYMVPYTELAHIDPEYTTLPADAPVGTWNFTAYNAGTGAKVDTNLFVVSAPATLDDVVDGIDEVKDTLADMTDMIDSIDGDVATIKGDTNTIKSLINALDIDIPDMSALTSGISEIKVAVSALDATVTAIAGDVATVDTKIGTLQGTVTSIDGNTATIETDVGTLTADISDVKANVDNTPAWIAVVLALVAAVAAIFAVITIRQKIAG